ERYLYKGALIPDNVYLVESVRHAVEVGLVEEAPVAAVAVEPTAVPATAPATGEDGSTPATPPAAPATPAAPADTAPAAPAPTPPGTPGTEKPAAAKATGK
ncbi:MAG TPA: hypothetical protein VIL55_08690, partial [Naasia sp.]